MDTKHRTALVTGVGRREGIGFEVTRQLAEAGFRVVLTGRSAEAARRLAETLRAEAHDVLPETLDVADAASVTALAARLEASAGALDVLVNNAAGMTSFGDQPSRSELGAAHAAMETTLFGAWRTTQALLPLLRRSASPRIVNVSSGAGSHGDVAFGLGTANAMGPAYAVSKAALNALTVTFANELRAERFLVNAVCPGFTATFPGGESMGARPVRDGARSVVWAALLADDGPTGGFFRDGARLPW